MRYPATERFANGVTAELVLRHEKQRCYSNGILKSVPRSRFAPEFTLLAYLERGRGTHAEDIMGYRQQRPKFHFFCKRENRTQ